MSFEISTQTRVKHYETRMFIFLDLFTQFRMCLQNRVIHLKLCKKLQMFENKNATKQLKCVKSRISKCVQYVFIETTAVQKKVEL